MNVLKIGIIDDDETKVTQIITYLIKGWADASAEKRTKYSEYQLEPVEIPLHSSLSDVLEYIAQVKVDCVLIDYRLSSYENVNFTGINVASALSKQRHGFPIFILTAYEDELYAKEVFDVYQVFNFDRYLNDANERIELNSKIIEQILKYRKEFLSWEQELANLLPRAGENAATDARILQLDSYIENALDGTHSIDTNVKHQLLSGKLDLLLEKLDKLIGKD